MWNFFFQNCHLFINYKFTNPFLVTLQLGRPGSRVARLWICKFLNNKQMAFLQNFISQQLLFFFYFQNIWIQCRMWQIVLPVKQIFDSVENFIQQRIHTQGKPHICLASRELRLVQDHGKDQKSLRSVWLIVYAKAPFVRFRESNGA